MKRKGKGNRMIHNKHHLIALIRLQFDLMWFVLFDLIWFLFFGYYLLLFYASAICPLLSYFLFSLFFLAFFSFFFSSFPILSFPFLSSILFTLFSHLPISSYHKCCDKTHDNHDRESLRTENTGTHSCKKYVWSDTWAIGWMKK